MPVGASKPDRVQGVFVSEKEVNGVVDFIKKQAPPDYDDEILMLTHYRFKKEDTAIAIKMICLIKLKNYTIHSIRIHIVFTA